MIRTVTLIGSGNVAHNLGVALQNKGLKVNEVFSRTKKNAKLLAEKLDANFIDELALLNQESDLYIVASSDNSIAQIASQIRLKDKILVHTSGSVEMEVLRNSSNFVGCFYPLQTFTKDHQTDFSEVPVCIESNNEKTLSKLENLSQKLTARTIHMSSIQRQKLHLAAVFVSNFVNYMQVIGQDLCKEQGVEFELLKPLIREVFDKNELRTARENQTGPALRGDSFTMNRHLEILKKDKQLYKLYSLISDMIESRKF